MKKIRDLKQLQILANTIREDIIKMLTAAGSGHSAGPLGMADVFTALYFNILNHNPKKPFDESRDRVILSNGHICPVLYATLARAGYFPVKELQTLRKLGTRLQGHPHYQSAPGVENSAGPLGQGISIATGIAYAAKMDNKKYTIYVSTGDGELNEGQCWEAFMFAAKNKLDNLIAFVDRNHIQIDGNTDDIMPLNSLSAKFQAFNWNTIEIDGNNMQAIIKAFEKAKKTKQKPSVIICKTIPGKGVSFMEKRFEWHGKPPQGEQTFKALDQLCKKECDLREFDHEKCRELIARCNKLE